jgi:CubicO group peptidase (beta-lactamase class C family)
MQGHLLDPAGMDATVFAATAPNTVPRVAGHEATPAGPAPVEPLLARSYGPAGTNILTTADDLLRFASTLLRQAPLRDLRTVHARPSIHGWLDAWSLGGAQFDWPGATVWGWDGLINGERSVLRILPELRAAVVVLTNGNTGRAMIRSLLSELMPKLYGIVVPPLNLTPSVGVAGDLSRFAGIYAWPDRRIEVTATADALRLITDDGESEARPIDGDTFLVDAADPDTPTITFGPPGRAGRPAVLYDMLWGLGRVDP